MGMGSGTRRRRRRPDDERGAIAVEFALVVPILVVLVMGIVEFGFYFADDVALRQQTREVGRQAAVANWGSTCTLPSGTTGSANVRRLMCRARTDTGMTTSGTVDVKVSFVNTSTVPETAGTYPTTVAINNGTATVSVRICLLATHDSVTKVAPFPGTSKLKSRVDYRLEKVTPSNVIETGGATDPTASLWSGWCP